MTRQVRVLVLAALVLVMAPAPAVMAEETKTLRWATSSVGSAGHRAKVNLMSLLNREMPAWRINVMPTPGAVASLRGYAMGQFDGYYGADIAFRELATDSGRFQGFGDRMQREPVQSFWAYSMEVGLAVRADDHADDAGWQSLDGRPVFTGPAPWDVRAQLERALHTLDVQHRYRELDPGLAGASLERGAIDAFIVYTAGESALAAWVTEAEMGSDIAVLNPSDEELERLREAGLQPVSIDPGVFRTDVGVETAWFVPFFYGFHLGLDIPAGDIYRMLEIIEENAAALAEADAVFAQIAEDMPDIQRRGVAATIDSARVHPGLARYMRGRGVWDSDWDERIAQ